MGSKRARNFFDDRLKFEHFLLVHLELPCESTIAPRPLTMVIVSFFLIKFWVTESRIFFQLLNNVMEQVEFAEKNYNIFLISSQIPSK